MSIKQSLLNVKCTLIVLTVMFVTVILMSGCGDSSGSADLYGFNPLPGGGAITLSWQAPSRNIDGSLLTDLAGFRVFYGTESRSYSNSIDILNYQSCSLEGLPVGDVIYFAVTAYDTSGNESDYSREVSVILGGE